MFCNKKDKKEDKEEEDLRYSSDFQSIYKKSTQCFEGVKYSEDILTWYSLFHNGVIKERLFGDNRHAPLSEIKQKIIKDKLKSKEFFLLKEQTECPDLGSKAYYKEVAKELDETIGRFVEKNNNLEKEIEDLKKKLKEN